MAPASPLTPDEIAAVRKPYRAASLLPGRAYHDPAIHEFERTEWFRRDWIVVGRESDVATAGTYCRWRRARITSGATTATSARTPAAWARIRRLRS